jgi:hypothetical protein
MATPKGLFDSDLVIAAWFDESQQVAGWFDADLVDEASTPAFDMAVTEAADTFAATVQEGFVLAATEGSDVAAANVQEGMVFAATEAADTLAATVDLAAVDLDMAATEEPDVAAAVVEADSAVSLDMAATEEADTALGTMAAANVVGGTSPRRRGGRHQILDTEEKWRKFHGISSTEESFAVPELPPTIEPSPARASARDIFEAVDITSVIDRDTIRTLTQALVARRQAELAAIAEMERIAADDDDEDDLELLLLAA